MRSESGRWYDTTTKQCVLEIPAKKGGTKKPNIADAVKLGLVKSVTTVKSVLASPALEAWKTKQILLSALTMPRPSGMSDADFIDKIFDESDQIRDEAAAEGKDYHAAAERYWKDGTLTHEDAAIANYLQCLDMWKRDMVAQGWSCWNSEQAFVNMAPQGNPLFAYAGTPDLVATCGKRLLVADYKTIADVSKWKGEPFDAWIMQLGAIFDALDPDDIFEHHAVQIVVGRATGEWCAPHEYLASELSRGKRMFRLANALWTDVNRWSDRIAANAVKCDATKEPSSERTKSVV